MSVRFVACLLLAISLPTVAAALEPVLPERKAVDPANMPLVESRVVLPKLVEGAGPTRIIPLRDYRIELDLRKQLLRVSTPEEHSWRTADEKIRAGDTVAVKGTGKRLRAGSQSIAELADGQFLFVTEVKGEWVAAGVVSGGQRRGGWVHASELRFQGEEPRISPTISRAGGDCVGASLLAQKAKQFDDGLYAAVEYAAQRGAGHFAGKATLLTKLTEALGKVDNVEPGDAIPSILTAGRLGGVKAELSKPLEAAVAKTTATFLADERRSKPLAFYTWSDDLKKIFQQDRMLQTELKGQAQIAAVLNALYSDPGQREIYEAYLKLVSGLTNPLNKPDLRPLLADLGNGKNVAAPERAHFFPPSRSHETDLVMRLFENRPIPEGFNLADELLRRIAAGDIDLTPQPTSGWYDYQTWSLEPLAVPDKMPEASQLAFDESYRKQLRELFKGVLALARETHIKQLEIPAPASDAGGRPEPRPVVFISPELAAEPLPSVYLRRAISYRFVRRVLEEAFGPDALKEMHRQTAAGPVEENLAQELTAMEGLLHGAYVAASLQIGLVPDAEAAAGSGQGAAARFLNWSVNLDRDADLGRDVRMMVPVFYDQQRKMTKVWAFLGWTQKRVDFNFGREPAVRVFDKEGRPVAAGTGPDVHFHGTGFNLSYPVVAEVYVNRILDRDEFRRHCDTYSTRTAILKNLP